MIKDMNDAHVEGVDIKDEADRQWQAGRNGWKQHVVTAAKLQEMKFPPLNYILHGFVAEGLTILAGRPKVGKSWLALDLCLGVAGGHEVLGVEPRRGDVLYVALEDNPRRLHRRISKLDDSWPQSLTLATSWRKLDEGGVDDISDWCKSVTDPTLVVLDTLAGVRPERGKDSVYQQDYETLIDLHRLAGERGLAVMVLHHTRKMDAEDPVDTISGTLGLAGCADTALVLARTSKGTTLYVRGRDIEEREDAIVFNAGTCRWRVLGDAAEVRRSETRQEILEALAGEETINPKQIVAATGLNRSVVDRQLSKMVRDGEVIQLRRGVYALPGRV